MTLTHYVQSSDYPGDLGATQSIWGAQGVFGTAGMFIFLTYISIPDLTKVAPQNGLPRLHTLHGSLKDEIEEQFMRRLVGLDENPQWQGGIRNPRVQKMIADVQAHHATLREMRSEYIEFFCRIIAISAIRASVTLGLHQSPEVEARYWRYMSNSLTMLGANLGDCLEAEHYCELFTAGRSRADLLGTSLLQQLLEHHPRYLTRSLSALLPPSRNVVLSLKEALDA